MIDAFRYGVGESGLYISQIYTNSDAYKSGLKPGDRIISANGKTISSEADLEAILDKCNVGDVLNLVVSRNGSEQNIKVTLSEKTSA